MGMVCGVSSAVLLCSYSGDGAQLKKKKKKPLNHPRRLCNGSCSEALHDYRIAAVSDFELEFTF